MVGRALAFGTHSDFIKASKTVKLFLYCQVIDICTYGIQANIARVNINILCSTPLRYSAALLSATLRFPTSQAIA